MLKLHREILKRLKALGFNVVKHETVKGHFHITVELPSGTHRLITAAGSPSAYEPAINCVIQTARRLLRADALQPQKEAS